MNHLGGPYKCTTTWIFWKIFTCHLRPARKQIYDPVVGVSLETLILENQKKSSFKIGIVINVILIFSLHGRQLKTFTLFLTWWNTCDSTRGGKNFFLCRRLSDHQWTTRILYVFICSIVLWRTLMSRPESIPYKIWYSRIVPQCTWPLEFFYKPFDIIHCIHVWKVVRN